MFAVWSYSRIVTRIQNSKHENRDCWLHLFFNTLYAKKTMGEIEVHEQIRFEKRKEQEYY